MDWTAEDAYAEYKKLLPEILSAYDYNEATTRLAVIDRIIFECLGWERGTEVESEKYFKTSGYADYVFDAEKHKSLVLEAKREDLAFLLQNKYPDRPVPLSLIAKESKDTADAFRQAQSYASELGTRFIAISNGRQWVFGLTYVYGQPVDDRQVFVFESLEAIDAKFRHFWNCFSKLGVRSNAVIETLAEVNRAPAPSKLSSRIIDYPRPAVGNQSRNPFSRALRSVWDEINQNDDSERFLRSCYVEPRGGGEHMKVAEELLKQRRAADEMAYTQSYAASDTLSKIKGLRTEKPILLTGRVGHGKSIFLKYLRTIAAPESLNSYVQIEVDFLHLPHDAAEVPAYVFSEIERSLADNFGIDLNEAGFVQGVLNFDLIQFNKSFEAIEAKKISDVEYRRLRLKFVSDIRTDRFQYLQRVFNHLKSGQGKSVSIYFDNLDRRPLPIQEEAYLRASAAAREWGALVFICLRQSTLYESRTAGVLDSVAPKVFVVAPPAPGLLLKRRFEFCRQYASGELSSLELGRPSLSRDFSAELPDVARLFDCFAFSSQRNKAIGALLVGISNGDNRKLIRTVGDVLVSGHLNTTKMLECLEDSGKYTVADHEVQRALLFRDSFDYDPSASLFVNLFDIRWSDAKSHFLKLAILEYAARFNDSATNRGFCSIKTLVAYCVDIGFSQALASLDLELLFYAGYLEAGSNVVNFADCEELRITERGRYHTNTLIRKFVYYDAIAVDLPMLDARARAENTDVVNISHRLNRARNLLRYLEACSNLLEDQGLKNVWASINDSVASNITDIENAIREPDTTIEGKAF